LELCISFREDFVFPWRNSLHKFIGSLDVIAGKL
jgi:hypothetical protein